MLKPSTYFTPFDREMGAEDKLSPPPHFNGPSSANGRRITDPLCALLLFASWGVASWIGVWSLQNGDYDSLFHPSDYKGRLCGVDKDLNGEVLPTYWHAVDILSNGICIEKCPKQIMLDAVDSSDLICKEMGDVIEIDKCTSNGTISDNPDVLVTCGACMYQMSTSEIMDYCLPDSYSAVVKGVNDAAGRQGLTPLVQWNMLQLAPYIQQLLRDFRKCAVIIIGLGFGGSVLLGMIYLYLLRVPKYIAATIWTSALLIPCCFAGGGAMLWILANSYERQSTETHSEQEIKGIRITAYIVWVLSAIVLCVLTFLRKQITLAASIARVAARSVAEVKASFVLPFIQIIGYASLLTAIGTWILFLASTATPVTQWKHIFGSDMEHVSQVYSKEKHYAFLFLLFCLVWTSSFIVALGQLTLSLCFSKWYFTIEKDDGNNVSLLACLGTILSKHIGTAAFGSLVIDIVQVVRAPILCIQKQIKKTGADNMCIDVFICSLQCCLFALERCMKFVDKNAYIQTSLFGHSFCKGSHESFYLVIRNASRMLSAGNVSWLSMFFTKIMIASGVCVASLVTMEILYKEAFFSALSVTAILSWFIGDMFTEVLGIAVATLLHCFLADEEMFGSEGSYYVPEEMDDFLKQLDDCSSCERRSITVPQHDNVADGTDSSQSS